MLRRSRSIRSPRLPRVSCGACLHATECGTGCPGDATVWLMSFLLHLRLAFFYPSMDAKLGFDENAEFRQAKVFEMRDKTQEDPAEVSAGNIALRSETLQYRSTR